MRCSGSMKVRPDVVIADDAEFERRAALLRVSDGGGHAGVRNGDDHIRRRGRFAGKLRPHLLADVIDVVATDDGVGPGEVDVLEDAGPRRPLRKRPVALDAAGGDGDDLAVLDLAHEFRADDVECAGFRCQHVSASELAEHQWADADRVARTDQHVVGQAHQRIGALDLHQRIDEPLDDTAALGARDEMQDHLGIGRRLADRAGRNELPPQRQRVREVAVVGDGEAAGVEVGEQRLHVAQNGVAGGRIAVMTERDVTLSLPITSALLKLSPTSPSRRSEWKWPPSNVTMPAASWPRCCRACRPSAVKAAASSWPNTPKTPHSSRRVSPVSKLARISGGLPWPVRSVMQASKERGSAPALQSRSDTPMRRAPCI